jgi:hypothetical protein
MADARFANTPSVPHRLGGFDQRPIFAWNADINRGRCDKWIAGIENSTETPVVSHEEIPLRSLGRATEFQGT